MKKFPLLAKGAEAVKGIASKFDKLSVTQKALVVAGAGAVIIAGAPYILSITGAGTIAGLPMGIGSFGSLGFGIATMPTAVAQGVAASIATTGLGLAGAQFTSKKEVLPQGVPTTPDHLMVVNMPQIESLESSLGVSQPLSEIETNSYADLNNQPAFLPHAPVENLQGFVYQDPSKTRRFEGQPVQGLKYEIVQNQVQSNPQPPAPEASVTEQNPTESVALGVQSIQTEAIKNESSKSDINTFKSLSFAKNKSDFVNLAENLQNQWKQAYGDETNAEHQQNEASLQVFAQIAGSPFGKALVEVMQQKVDQGLWGLKATYGDYDIRHLLQNLSSENNSDYRQQAGKLVQSFLALNNYDIALEGENRVDAHQNIANYIEAKMTGDAKALFTQNMQSMMQGWSDAGSEHNQAEGHLQSIAQGLQSGDVFAQDVVQKLQDKIDSNVWGMKEKLGENPNMQDFISNFSNQNPDLRQEVGKIITAIVGTDNGFKYDF
jgi:hypothetical protein